MDWNDLQIFLAVARGGTLSAAARALGVSQSTMSRRVEAMERRAGARLLQKTPDGYVLTALGEAVLGNAERMEAEAMAVERAVLGRDVALAGIVRVTTVDTLAARVLTLAIADLQCTHPGITVELLPETRSLNLSRREADIAVRLVRFEGHELIERRIGSFVSALYASPRYLDQHATRARSSGEQHAIVTVLEDQMHLPEPRWLADQVPDARVALRSNSREVQLWGAKSGLGIACLACHRAEAEPGLVRLTAFTDGPVRDIWLGVHRDLRHTPRVRVVIDAITAEVKRQAAMLMPRPPADLTAPGAATNRG